MSNKNEENAMLEEITRRNCGQKLPLICKAAGISLKELADVLGEKQSTLSHIKRGPKQGRLPTQRFMDKLRALALIRPNGLANECEEPGKLTAAAVAVGLAAIARTKLLGTMGVVAGAFTGGLVGAVLSFGVLHAVDAICRRLGLAYREADDRVEITRDKEG